MYLLINVDNTVNYADDHPIDERLCFAEVTLLEFPHQRFDEVMKGIPVAQACWSPHQQGVVEIDWNDVIAHHTGDEVIMASEDNLDEEETP